MRRKTKNERKADPGRVGIGKFWAWQSRGIACACDVMILALISVYCSTTMGMSTALVGTILMVSKIFDGFTDLVAGYLVDRTNTKIGRGRPYELAVIGLWITTWLLFSMPEAGMTVKCIWLFAMYTLNQSIFQTLLNANGTVYMVRAFSNEQQYLKINAMGGIAVTLGAIVVNVMLPITVARMATSAAGWSRMVLYYCIPLGIISLMRFIFVKEENNIDAKSALMMIRMLMTLIPMAFYLVLAIALNFYRLDDLMPQIRTDLATKHAAEEPAAVTDSETEGDC